MCLLTKVAFTVWLYRLERKQDAYLDSLDDLVDAKLVVSSNYPQPPTSYYIFKGCVFHKYESCIFHEHYWPSFSVLRVVYFTNRPSFSISMVHIS